MGKGGSCLGSVSYTHLDVYKRQTLFRGKEAVDEPPEAGIELCDGVKTRYVLKELGLIWAGDDVLEEFPERTSMFDHVESNPELDSCCF